MHFPFMAPNSPTFPTVLVLFDCGRLPGRQDDGGFNSWKSFIFENMPDTTQATSTIFPDNGWVSAVSGMYRRSLCFGNLVGLQINAKISNVNQFRVGQKGTIKIALWTLSEKNLIYYFSNQRKRWKKYMAQHQTMSMKKHQYKLHLDHNSMKQIFLTVSYVLWQTNQCLE